MAIRNLQQFNRDADFEYEPDLVVNKPAQNASPIIPQKTIQPVNQQTMAAPLFSQPTPQANTLENYLASQQSAFKPQLLQAGTYSVNEGGENSTPDVYSTFDPSKATQDYLTQQDAARPGWDKSYTEGINSILNYRKPEYFDKLIKDIGYTGNTKVNIGSQGTLEGESGTYALPDSYAVDPAMLDAMAGYKTVRTTTANGDPGVAVYKPDGTQVGVYRVGDAPTALDKVMEVGIPLFLGSLTGGLGAGALGLSGLAGAATTGAIGSATSTAIQGGDLKDILKAAAMGGITGGAGAGITKALGSAFAPAGYMPGEVAAGGIGTQIQSTISSGLQDIGLPADLSNSIASYTKPIAGSALKGGVGALVKGESVLGGLGEGLATGFSDAVTGKLFNSGVDLAAGQPVKDAVSDTLKSVGLSENAADYVANLVRPVVSGGLSAAITGNDIAEGAGTSLLNAVAKDVGKELGLNPKQSQIAADYLRTGNEDALINALGQQMAGAVNNAAKNSAAKIDAGSGSSFEEEGGESGIDDILYPADSQTEVPSIDEELGFSNYTPTVEELVESLETTPQQVVVTPPKPSIDQELGFSNYVAPIDQELGFSEYDLPVDLKMSGEHSNIALGQEPQQVTVTGKNSEDYLYNPTAREVTAIQPSTEVDVGKYLDSLPQDVASTLPEILAQAPAPAPAPASAPVSAPASAPVTKQDSGFDLSSLMLLLGMGGKESAPPPIELVKGLKFDPNSFYQDSSSGSMDDLVRLLQSRG